MNDFSEAVISTIRSIPRGKVLTYGAVALLAGNYRAARRVAWLLHSTAEKYQLPWHRVINAKGEISLEGEGRAIQCQLLEAEGVTVNDGYKINLNKYLWKQS